MPQDMYSDAPPDAEPQGDAAEPKESGDTPTAVLPKDFFHEGDLKPGYVCQVKVARVHDDQVEVEYMGNGGQEEQGEQPNPAPAMAMPGGGGDMGGMMTDG